MTFRDSDVSLAAAFAPETGAMLFFMVTIDHADLSSPIRVVNNNENIDFGGYEYIGYPFELTLPNDIEDQDVIGHLVIDNVSQEIAQAIRSISSAPTVSITLIRYDGDIETWTDETLFGDGTGWSPSTVGATLPTFLLRDVSWDAQTVTGSLVAESLVRAPFPPGRFTPGNFPGLF